MTLNDAIAAARKQSNGPTPYVTFVIRSADDSGYECSNEPDACGCCVAVFHGGTKVSVTGYALP